MSDHLPIKKQQIGIGHMQTLREYWWRSCCPVSFESIADDFIFNRNIWTLAEWVEYVEIDDGFALRRRISAIYGIATNYRHPRDLRVSRGWNRRLWRVIGDKNPEHVVDEIFAMVKSQIKKAAEEGSAGEFERRVRTKKGREQTPSAF